MGKNLYYSYEELRGYHPELQYKTYFKPSGTMGSHHCIVSDYGDHYLIEGCGKKITISRGESFGYQCGDVWRVPSPARFSNPVRRAIAQLYLPQSILTFSDKNVSEDYWLKEVDARHPEWLLDTDGYRIHKVLGELSKVSSQHCEESGDQMHEYAGGEAIIIISKKLKVTTYLKRIQKIIVRPSADMNAVADWLLENIDLSKL